MTLNVSFAESAVNENESSVVSEVFACCSETRSEGTPGESGYSKVTVTSCYTTSPPRDSDMTQACHQAAFRAARLATLLAGY